MRFLLRRDFLRGPRVHFCSTNARTVGKAFLIVEAQTGRCKHRDSEPDRIRHVAPDGGSGLFKFPEEVGLVRRVGKERVDRLEVRAGHGENVVVSIHQGRRQRLAADAADIRALLPLRRRGPREGLEAGLAPREPLAGERPPDLPAVPEQARRNRPSAMGLRQMFPVQTKRTFFTISAPARAGKAKLEFKRNHNATHPP